ncbi:hypothetical protein DERP_002763 [Dermatophagoides pteronyssinus]|uniref:Uncharacterized protein LOC113798468 n=2 Tax=Dermatophagoides pteronyssinus TaxID=6956 RepID=A0A6P6YHQ6_DERPT|nr:uncharacterized protein LOC113798468 [Dermatophagoides pteronyssinus]KAH9426664.1 hypothetical protein DERP_002763 [Dermatophagoides pteronyssinus]
MSDHHHQKKSDSSSTITNENPELQNLMKDNVQITFSSIKNLNSFKVNNQEEFIFLLDVAHNLTVAMTKYKLKNTSPNIIRMLNNGPNIDNNQQQ